MTNLMRFLFTTAALLLTFAPLQLSAQSLNKPHRHLLETKGFATEMPEFSMKEVSLASSATRENVVRDRAGKYDAFTVDGTRIFVRERGSKKTLEICGLPLAWRPFSDLAWTNNYTLVFDRWSQPHYGVHYAVNVAKRTLVDVTPFPDETYLQENKKIMTNKVSGTFEVKLTPESIEAGGAGIGKLSVAKQLTGGLQGTTKGLMLAVRTSVEGSAGYVAMEEVEGTLEGRKGTFMLQHSGTMTRGTPNLSVTVVPDSGTGELVGLTGKMDIQVTDGKHYYQMEYTLPQAAPKP